MSALPGQVDWSSSKTWGSELTDNRNPLAANTTEPPQMADSVVENQLQAEPVSTLS